MRRVLLPLIAVGLLAGCAHQFTPTQAAIVGCTAYDSALESLTVRRKAGLLSPEQIAKVDELRKVATPLCTAETPPSGAQATLDNALIKLEAILAEAAAKEAAK